MEQRRVKVLRRRKAVTLRCRISGEHGEPACVKFEMVLVKRTQSAWLREFLWPWAAARHRGGLGLLKARALVDK